MILRNLIPAFLCLVATSLAARLTVEIAASPQLPNPSTLPSSTHAVLLGPPGVRYDVPLRRDNTFLFPSLEAGSYLLTIHARDHTFAPLRVDITKKDKDSQESINVYQTFRGNEWANKGPLVGTSDITGTDSLKLPVRAAGTKEFYHQRQGFSIVAFLKSPMILMALVSGVMIFGLPYLMENMDEETKKEFQDISAKSPITGDQGGVSQIQNFDLAGWMAGKSAGSSGTSTPSGGGGGGESRKKR